MEPVRGGNSENAQDGARSFAELFPERRQNTGRAAAGRQRQS